MERGPVKFSESEIAKGCRVTDYYLKLSELSVSEPDHPDVQIPPDETKTHFFRRVSTSQEIKPDQAK